MRRIFLFLIFFTIQFGLAQSGKPSIESINASGAVRISFVQNQKEAEKLAETDLDNGIQVLFLQSGIAPVTYTTDELFENKYKVYYYEFGCISPEHSFVKAYNNQVFIFLDKKFGKDWRKKIRKDIIGFKEYKKSH